MRNPDVTIEMTVHSLIVTVTLSLSISPCSPSSATTNCTRYLKQPEQIGSNVDLSDILLLTNCCCLLRVHHLSDSPICPCSIPPVLRSPGRRRKLIERIRACGTVWCRRATYIHGGRRLAAPIATHLPRPSTDAISHRLYLLRVRHKASRSLDRWILCLSLVALWQLAAVYHCTCLAAAPYS